MSHYHFFWQEQNQLFLPSGDWLSTYFNHPAWMGCMAGDYLTQFYYYKWAGPAILLIAAVATLLLLWLCLRRSMPRWAVAVSLGLVAIWIVGCSMDIYYRLPSLLCLMGGIALAIPAKKVGWWGLLAIPLAFWLFGYGAIITAIIYAWMHCRSIYKPLAAFALLALCPLPYSSAYAKDLCYPGIGVPTFGKGINKELMAIDNEYYFGNYKRVEEIALGSKDPNAVLAFYYYLSKAKQDSLPDYLLTYPILDIGTLNQIGENTPLPVINMMNDLYYELGDMMYAERAAMMRNVFSPQNRNARMVKRLAEANLVSGDTAAATKYLRILAQTPAYRSWAKKRIPGHMDPAVEDQILRKRELSNAKDNMRLGDNCRNILLELLESNPNNKLALDYLLCTDLLLRQMDTFKMDYDRYCMQEGQPRIRKLYQEALMVYLAGTNAPAQEWEKYIVPGEITTRFQQYNRRRGDRAFADTYWYYFDTAK